VSPKPLPTIFIAGARRNAGKTLLTTYLLRSFPGSGAIKVTCCRTAGGCPRNTPCGVCRALSGPYAVITDRDVLATPGKDTARLLEAAMGRVVWLQARPETLADGLAAALLVFDREQAVLVEGNAAFQTGAPDLGLLVIGPGPEPAKSSVRVALPFADGVVLNVRPGYPSPAMVEGLRGDVRVFSFDAANAQGQADARSLVEWITQKLGLTARAQVAEPTARPEESGSGRSPGL